MPKNIAERRPPSLGPRALDRDSALPLYHQLFIDLRRRLLSAEWRSGEAFPRDADILAEYDVSRITVRQALAQLVDLNYVVRYRGKGSFVGNLPKSGARANHRLVAEEIREAGREPSHRNLGIEHHVGSEVTADQLDIEVGDKVVILKRLHLADGEPFCIEWVMLPEERYPDVFDRVMADMETLTDAYRRLGIYIAKAEQTVTAMLLSPERRLLLKLAEGIPAIYVERVGYTASNHPIEVRRLHYRSDNFALRQEIIWGEPDRRIVESSGDDRGATVSGPTPGVQQ